MALNFDSFNINSLKLESNASANGTMAIQTRLEKQDTDKFINNIVTISCEMKTNRPDIARIEYSNDGSIAKVGEAPKNTDEWEVVKLTFVYDSLSSADNYVSFGFGPIDAAHDIEIGDYIEIRNTQFCVGRKRLYYIPQTYQEELLKCLRYYWNIVRGNDLSFCNIFIDTGSLAFGVLKTPVRMRTIATEVVSSPTHFKVNYGGGTATVDVALTISSGSSTEDLLEVGCESTNDFLTPNSGGIIKSQNASAVFSANAEI